MEETLKFMRAAYQEALKAEALDEVPIGAVIVMNHRIIARGHNLRENKNLVMNHAEMIAIAKANKKLHSWRLEQCDIYVTLEPCLMCTGALIQSRIQNIYFGAKDFKGGALGSSINALESKNINHHPNVVGGIMEKECASLLSDYFRKKRKEK